MRKLQRSARRIVSLALLLLSPCIHPDIAHTIDDGPLGGTVQLDANQDALTLTNEQGQARQIPIIDLDQVVFHRKLAPTPRDNQLLIDNDKAVGNPQNAARIKLRRGLHRMTLAYWQGEGEHQLNISVAGPGIIGTVELADDHLRCFRETEDDTPNSKGVDEEGFRLPELASEEADNRRRFINRARFSLYASDEGQLPQNVSALANMQLKRTGTTTSINSALLNEHNRAAGLVIDAFFVAPQDGEYLFTLKSDNGSKLYLGKTEDFTSNQTGDKPVHTPWRAELAHDGVARGELRAIADETLTFHVPLVSDVTLALNHTHTLWDTSVAPASISRDNEPADQDTLYIRDKNDPASIRSVSGKVLSLDDTSLSFDFRGQTRSITRDRLVGIVFKHASRPAPPAPGLYQLLMVQGGQQLPCHVKGIDTHVRVQLLGGSLATPPRDVVRSMLIENGRRIDLTKIAPTAEEAIPYFGLKIPHRINTNFSGRAVTLFDDKTYERAISVHSKSRLHYKLKPGCERFQATLGLLAPAGKLGNITARVIADDQILWERDNITAQTPPIPIDVPLPNAQRLILEVDFGQGQDVGDRAAWCDPRLLYNPAQP